MGIESFCKLLTLQIGVAMLSLVTIVLGIVTIFVNAFDFNKDNDMWSFIIAVVFSVLLIAAGIVMLLAAYKESMKLSYLAILFLCLIALFWVAMTVLAFLREPDACVNERCAESFWVANLHNKKYIRDSGGSGTVTPEIVTEHTNGTQAPHLNTTLTSLTPSGRRTTITTTSTNTSTPTTSTDTTTTTNTSTPTTSTDTTTTIDTSTPISTITTTSTNTSTPSTLTNTATSLNTPTTPTLSTPTASSPKRKKRLVDVSTLSSAEEIVHKMLLITTELTTLLMSKDSEKKLNNLHTFMFPKRQISENDYDSDYDSENYSFEERGGVNPDNTAGTGGSTVYKTTYSTTTTKSTKTSPSSESTINPDDGGKKGSSSVSTKSLVGAIIFTVINVAFFLFTIIIMWSYIQELKYMKKYGEPYYTGEY